MRGAERGFLLLACHLGDPERKILSVSQLRTLAMRVRGRDAVEREGELTPSNLKSLGYSNLAIISKYLIYAGSGAVVGCGLGVLLGSVVFPAILWQAYKIMLYITEIINLPI